MIHFRWFHFLLIILLLVILLIFANFLFVKPISSLTIKDLPKDARYSRHPSEELEAETSGKIVMSHYVTPEAMQAGGPIYGIMGYRIVSIEYEIPVREIPTKTVGQEFSGYLLNLPEFKNIRYDHFHISSQKHGLASHSDQEIYSIHFMLIPHEEELSFGLVCE